jgi:hypothetical protein
MDSISDRKRVSIASRFGLPFPVVSPLRADNGSVNRIQDWIRA